MTAHRIFVGLADPLPFQRMVWRRSRRPSIDAGNVSRTMDARSPASSSLCARAPIVGHLSWPGHRPQRRNCRLPARLRRRLLHRAGIAGPAAVSRERTMVFRRTDGCGRRARPASGSRPPPQSALYSLRAGACASARLWGIVSLAHEANPETCRSSPGVITSLFLSDANLRALPRLFSLAGPLPLARSGMV